MWASERTIENGRILWAFSETPPLCIYFLILGLILSFYVIQGGNKEGAMQGRHYVLAGLCAVLWSLPNTDYLFSVALGLGFGCLGLSVVGVAAVMYTKLEGWLRKSKTL